LKCRLPCAHVGAYALLVNGQYGHDKNAPHCAVYLFTKEWNLFPNRLPAPADTGNNGSSQVHERLKPQSMKSILILLCAIAIMPFAGLQAISFVEKCETYRARVTRENIENTMKIAALLAQAHAQTIRPSNESDFGEAYRSTSKKE
jgi:hypothetical protein